MRQFHFADLVEREGFLCKRTLYLSSGMRGVFNRACTFVGPPSDKKGLENVVGRRRDIFGRLTDRLPNKTSTNMPGEGRRSRRRIPSLREGFFCDFTNI